MRDYVIVLFTPSDFVSNRVSVELCCIPAFLRFPLLGDDDAVLQATCSTMRVLKSVVAAEAREYAGLTRRVASGATSFVALPKQWGVVRTLGMLMHPWVAYSTFALTQLCVVTGDMYSKADLITALYGIVLPRECPECCDASSWAVLRTDAALCLACGYCHVN